MTVTVARACLRGPEIGALVKQHGFEAIKLCLHVGRAPELYVDLMLLTLKLDSLPFDETPLFLKFRTDRDVASHVALLSFGTPKIEWLG
jgi:hypothetical protein